MSNGNTILEEIDTFLASVSNTKAAETASAQGHVENQGDSGTSHPSKSVDDGTQTATEGSRSAENTADVKRDVPAAVDEAKEDKMDGASENPLTTAKPTGEDPANETSSANGLIGGDAGKDHAGKDTSHPAKVDFGGKYASVKEAADDLANRINDYNAKLAALTVDDAPAPVKKEKTKEAAATSDPKSDKAETKEASDDTEDADVAAGRAAAEQAIEQLSKVAADAEATDTNELIAEVVKSAVEDANLLIDFYAGMHDGVVEKRAEAAKAGKDAGKLRDALKKAMEAAGPEASMPEDEGADSMAYGGDSESGEPAEGGAPGGGENQMVEQVIAALEQAGIDPSILAELPPEALAEALSMIQGGGGAESGEGGGGSEAMAQEPMPAEAPTDEMAPAVAG